MPGVYIGNSASVDDDMNLCYNPADDPCNFKGSGSDDLVQAVIKDGPACTKENPCDVGESSCNGSDDNCLCSLKCDTIESGDYVPGLSFRGITFENKKDFCYNPADLPPYTG